MSSLPANISTVLAVSGRVNRQPVDPAWHWGDREWSRCNGQGGEAGSRGAGTTTVQGRRRQSGWVNGQPIDPAQPPLRGGLGLGTRDICGRNSTSRKASAIWGPQMLRVVGSFMYIIYTGRLKRVNLTNRWSYRNFKTSPKTVLKTFSYFIRNTKLSRFLYFFRICVCAVA